MAEIKSRLINELKYHEYIRHADVKYGYDIGYTLSEDVRFHNTSMGGRTAGSDAEHLAADYLVSKMQEIGLVEVQKVPAKIHKWQQSDSKLVINDKTYVISSYAAGNTGLNGLTAEIVYVNEGTMHDYKDLDAEGKIVLIDLDMRNRFWINYPLIQAEYQKAKAILSANKNGYSQINDTALNNQDICSPFSEVVCASIGLKDSLQIQQIIKKGPTTATLYVNNEYDEAGTTYNVIGKIKGHNREYQTIYGAHYDMYFKGFQDDNIACGLALAIAKGMVDSKIKPMNDIVFCLHGAEEWGRFNTQYDWTLGAYEMVNTLKTEWTKKTKAFINFELTAFRFNDFGLTASSNEYFSLLDFYSQRYEHVPSTKDVYLQGVHTDGLGLYTFSDDFTYSIAGIPSFVNGSVTFDSVKTGSNFMKNYYHSNFDTYETYDEMIMKYNLEYYGGLGLLIDQLPIIYLDFTSQYHRIKDTVDEINLKRLGIHFDELNRDLEHLLDVSRRLNYFVEGVNFKSLTLNHDEELIALNVKHNQVNKLMLESFKFIQDHLVNLMYEKPIVPHYAPLENVLLMEKTIACLNDLKIDEALNEYVPAINNFYEFNNMYFNKEVSTILNDDHHQNLFWGTNKKFTKALVEDASRSLMVKKLNHNNDFTEEITIYMESINVQTKLIQHHIDNESIAITRLIERLNEVCKLLEND